MATVTIYPGPEMEFNTTKASLAISQKAGADIESWVRIGERPRTSEKDYKHKNARNLILKEKLGEQVDGSHSGHYAPKVDDSHSCHMSNADGSHSGHYSLEDGSHSGHMASTAQSTSGSFDYEHKSTQELILKRHRMQKLALEVLADEHQQEDVYEDENQV